MADAGTPSLSVSWIDRPDELWLLRAEWQALAERTAAEVYMRPTWQSVWWDHFGQGRRLACLTIRDGGRLAGLLPFCVEHLWAGPVPVRVARLAGTDPHCMVLRLPLEDGISLAALSLAVAHLTGPLGCAAVSFTPVSDRAAHLPALRTLGSDLLAVHEAPAGTHVMFDLPATFSEWLGRLSKKRRSQFQRDVRGLEQAFNMQGAEITPGGATFADFASFHDLQWQAVGRGGHFTDWAGSLDFYRDLAGQPTDDPPMQLHCLTGSSGPLATQFALVDGGTAHWRLPARSLDPEAERLSIGKVGLLRMIEALIAEGVTRVEAGRGEYGYKLSYGGENIAVHRLLVSPRTASASLRLRLLLGWADLLHFAYYRVWFLKLGPRLRSRFGFRPRPLWRAWVRSQL